MIPCDRTGVRKGDETAGTIYLRRMGVGGVGIWGWCLGWSVGGGVAYFVPGEKR